jgi:hypothetical protein
MVFGKQQATEKPGPTLQSDIRFRNDAQDSILENINLCTDSRRERPLIQEIVEEPKFERKELLDAIEISVKLPGIVVSLD